MLTVAEIIDIAKVSQYLSANDVERGGLWGGGLNKTLTRKLYLERKSVEYVYDLDDTVTTLAGTSNYLYALCAPYLMEAKVIIAGGGGGTVVVPSGPSGSTSDCTGVVFLSSADFEADGITVIRTDWLGLPLKIFWNDIPKFITNPTDWNYYPGGGFQVAIPGFDANTNDYNFYVFVGCFDAGGSTSDFSNETVSFSGVSSVTLTWSAARIANFGAQGSFQVQIFDGTNYVVTIVSITANDPDNPTSYLFEFGGTSTGRIIIS